jgi:DeoR/GlpR family transcriptional regulator of sugar metabolism
MLPAQRRECILEQILKDGSADTESLARQFGVSTMTIRRDLRSLEEHRHILVTHGGAVARGFLSQETPYDNKSVSRLEAKRRIAAAALELVEDNTCIILDAGTTTLELARLLLPRTLSVITTDLRIALLLAESPTLCVHTTGGKVDGVSKSQVDASALHFLQSTRAALAFLGTNAFDPAFGVTTANVQKQYIKRQILRVSKRAVLLADSSKYGFFSPWCVADLSTFDSIITDDELSQPHRDKVVAAGGKLRIAGQPA